MNEKTEKQGWQNFHIKTFKTLSSTNTWSLENLDTLNDSDVIFAKTQTDGRGRLERKWQSFEDGKVLCFSIVLKPDDINNYPLANLTQYMSVVICEELEKLGLCPNIKWPNDVLIDGKKIAGILSEAHWQGNRLKGIVLGAGININLSEDELKAIDKPATSLLHHCEGSKAIHLDNNKLLNNILQNFFSNYNNFTKKGFSLIKNNYINRCNFIGKEITINLINKSLKGKAKAINDDGLLLLENANGEKLITTGDLLI